VANVFDPSRLSPQDQQAYLQWKQAVQAHGTPTALESYLIRKPTATLADINKGVTRGGYTAQDLADAQKNADLLSGRTLPATIRQQLANYHVNTDTAQMERNKGLWSLPETYIQIALGAGLGGAAAAGLGATAWAPAATAQTAAPAASGAAAAGGSAAAGGAAGASIPADVAGLAGSGFGEAAAPAWASGGLVGSGEATLESSPGWAGGASSTAAGISSSPSYGAMPSAGNGVSNFLKSPWGNAAIGAAGDALTNYFGTKNANQQANANRALQESTLDPFRHQVDQARDAAYLDRQASPFKPPAGMEAFTPSALNPRPDMQTAAGLLRDDVLSGHTAPTMTDPNNFGKTGTLDLLTLINQRRRPTTGQPPLATWAQ
jgi:hypothetical protein